MERSTNVVLGLLVAIGAVAGYRRYEASQLSLFRMWDIRAGERFSTLDDDAEREMHRRFDCQAIEGGVRLCEAKTVVPGLMRLAVDTSGRTMIVQWRVADSSLRMTEEARRMAAEWTLVEPRHSRSAGAGGRGVTRWLTRDSAWSASMTDLDDPHRTRSINLVDERRLRKAAAASAAALLQLAERGYLDHDALAAEFARAPEALAAAAVALGATGRTRAVAATALPRCPFQGGDGVVPGGEMASAYGIGDAALIEQSIAGAFPGMHLVLGKRAYLVDGDGSAEEIRVLPPASDGDEFAIAVTFPRRVEAVDRLVREFAGTVADCRASAVVIIGKRDSVTGQPGALRIIDADEESLTSAIGALDPLPTVSESPSFVIHYTATYGTRGWIGEMDWDAVAQSGHGDSRIIRRVPSVVGRKDSDDHEIAGIAVVEKESPAGLQLSIVRETDDAPTPLFIASGPRGLPSGWMLLDQLH